MVGYLNNNFDKQWKLCPMEKFYEIASSESVAKAIAAVRGGNKNAKRSLPAFLFAGRLDEARYKEYLAQCQANGTKPKGSRCEEFLLPTGFFMMDFDRTEGDAYALYMKFMQTMRERGIETKGFLALAHRTPGGHGLRLVLCRRAGSTIEADQRWIAGMMQEEIDEVCKDLSRLSYAVTTADIFYCDNELLFSEEMWTDSDKGLVISEETANHSSLTAKHSNTFPTTYKGVAYSEILAAIAEELGGEPEEGERNAKVLRMASSLRHICDNNAEWLMEIIPTYGLPEEEWKKTIQNACKDGLKYGTTKVLQAALSKLRVMSSELRVGDYTALSTQNSELSSTPPKMPSKLPPLIELLTSRTPDIYKPAVAHAVFPALGVHLHNTTFRYIDNVRHEATLMNVLMAPTGAGKNCITEPINRIMADIRVRDEENLAREKAWKDEVNRKGANKDKQKRPEGLVIQEIDADMTNPAFVMRMAEANGHFLYTRLNEIDQFNALKGNGKGGQHFQIMCLAFDPNNRYGQTRVGTQSVTEKVTIRFNWNASTTVDKGVRYFNGVLTDGPISRINFCTIPEREIGAEMPIYGTYDEAFDEQLAPYIERLVAANGLVDCPEAYALAKRLRDESAEVAIKSQDRTYENLSFRANVIAYLKACVLHVAHGGWDESFDEFIRWSKEYDLWCKMHFFGAEIEAEEERGRAKRSNSRGPQNNLDFLAVEFGIEQVRELYARLRKEPRLVKESIRNWVRRGYIIEVGNNRYRKVK